MRSEGSKELREEVRTRLEVGDGDPFVGGVGLGDGAGTQGDGWHSLLGKDRRIAEPRRADGHGTVGGEFRDKRVRLEIERSKKDASHKLSSEAERALVAEYYQRVFGTELPESVVGKA